ncbi:hypothetical protein H7J88_17450 [Mycolicibacterium flavescens]|uniref:hypothetical protein n=1 Tax=Mycolicibacterium flavescens TaxID=1776 RepID=UPI00104247AB|nr:hypothetical protein [Mycolicibacterium flavescens]MCV7281425.1 hypothetical protein [Mycolicibacterium flavescens]
MSLDDTSAIAVVHSGSDAVAIWHVAVEPVVQTARLCGAWVTRDADVQQRVIRARKVVLVNEVMSDRLESLLTHSDGAFDVEATLTAIRQHIDRLDEIHRTSFTPKGSPRAPISWPSLPPSGTPLSVPVGVVQTPLIRSTIAMARWLADLANVWSAVESIRVSKAHLKVDSPSPQPLPFQPADT